jgi:hypothetical protein
VGPDSLSADLRPGRAPAIDAAGGPLLIGPVESSPPPHECRAAGLGGAVLVS